MANIENLRVDHHFLRQLSGYTRLTMVIWYYMPDKPLIICSNPFIYQIDDKAPTFPEMNNYLKFWGSKIDAAINRVDFACAQTISAAEFRSAQQVSFLH